MLNTSPLGHTGEFIENLYKYENVFYRKNGLILIAGFKIRRHMTDYYYVLITYQS